MRYLGRVFRLFIRVRVAAGLSIACRRAVRPTALKREGDTHHMKKPVKLWYRVGLGSVKFELETNIER